MNIFYPPGQEKIFFVMLVFGAALGIVCDFFKIKRRLLGSSHLIIFFDDLIFSLVAVISFLFTVFIVNNGIFRWFEVFFSILGFCFYNFTVSKVVLLVSFRIIDLILIAVRRILFVVFYPIKYILNLLYIAVLPIQQEYIRICEKKSIIKHIDKLTSIRKCKE